MNTAIRFSSPKLNSNQYGISYYVAKQDAITDRRKADANLVYLMLEAQGVLHKQKCGTEINILSMGWNKGIRQLSAELAGINYDDKFNEMFDRSAKLVERLSYRQYFFLCGIYIDAAERFPAWLADFYTKEVSTIHSLLSMSETEYKQAVLRIFH
jgi:hypothetical protein